MTAMANQLEVIRARGGRAFIAVDSLVTLFDDLAETLKGDEKSHRNLRAIADSLRPASSFAEIAMSFAKPSPIEARRCECGTPVVDGKLQEGPAVVVNAHPSHQGEFVPVDRPDGGMTMIAWQPRFDGSNYIRLTRHKCLPRDASNGECA